jgi:uncharacterized protein YbjT (DUF2867 family)
MRVPRIELRRPRRDNRMKREMPGMPGQGEAMILVTGATGTIGREVVRQLSAAGQTVRALVHSAAKTGDVQGPGVERAVADFGQREALRAALAGVDRLFLVSPADKPATIAAQEDPVVQEAKRAGVRHIVKLSVIGANMDRPIELGRWHREAEQVVEASGIPWTFLRPNFFMASFAVYMGATIRTEGAFYAPAGDGRISMIDPVDIAACAVAAFADSSHQGRAYDLTGAEALSLTQAAERLSRACGKTIRYVDLPDDAYRGALLGAGLIPRFVDAYIQFWDIVKAGYAAAISPAVEQLTGSKPRTLDDWARDNAASLL